MNSSSSHKRLLTRLVLVLHVVVAAVLIAAAQLPSFDASAALVLGTVWPTSLLRWDAFHFAHIARDGYVYEYEYAFLPGIAFVMRYGAKLLELLCVYSGSSIESVLVAGALASAALSVDTTLTLYELTLYHFSSPSTALLASLLSLLSSSPATLRHAPYTEPFFTYLSYKGMLFCSRKHYAYASVAFALASAFRSNGIVLAGYIVWGMLVEPAFLSSSDPRNILSIKTIRKTLYCGLLSIVSVLPFLLHQYNGYIAFCTVPLDERRPWCSNKLPLIYSFVQSTYWDSGPFRYWTLQQLPNILLATPVLALLFYASVSYMHRAFVPHLRVSIQSLCDSGNSGGNTQGLGRHENTIHDPFFSLSIAPHAFHALILCTMLLVSAHTQIALRLVSAVPFTYWAAARLLLGDPHSDTGPRSGETLSKSDLGENLNPVYEGKAVGTKTHVLGRAARWWVGWSVLWGVLSLVNWAVFLPPA